MCKMTGEISNHSVEMMRQVLGAECMYRKISDDSVEGEDLALVIMTAFREGMTSPTELAVLVRNLVDTDSMEAKVVRHNNEIKLGHQLL